MTCNDPSHQEPFACHRLAEGGWTCADTFEVEELREQKAQLTEALRKAQFIVHELHAAHTGTFESCERPSCTNARRLAAAPQSATRDKDT